MQLLKQVFPAGAMVAHLTSNQGVPGSIPGSGRIPFYFSSKITEVIFQHGLDKSKQTYFSKNFVEKLIKVYCIMYGTGRCNTRKFTKFLDKFTAVLYYVHSCLHSRRIESKEFVTKRHI